jgi:hypothetical protein
VDGRSIRFVRLCDNRHRRRHHSRRAAVRESGATMVRGSNPVDWILPVVLVAGWIGLWATRRRVPRWFFVAGVVLAALCVPAGMIAGKAAAGGPDCSAGNLCFSMGEVDLWVNGLFGFFATGLLALVTMIVQAVATVARRDR